MSSPRRCRRLSAATVDRSSTVTSLPQIHHANCDAAAHRRRHCAAVTSLLPSPLRYHRGSEFHVRSSVGFHVGAALSSCRPPRSSTVTLVLVSLIDSSSCHCYAARFSHWFLIGKELYSGLPVPSLSLASHCIVPQSADFGPKALILWCVCEIGAIVRCVCRLVLFLV